MSLQSGALANKEVVEPAMFRLLVNVEDLIAEVEGHARGRGREGGEVRERGSGGGRRGEREVR